MTGTSESIKDKIWEGRLDARQLTRYWTYLATRRTRWDRLSKLWLTASASSTVASVGTTLFTGSDLTILTAVLGGATALISIASSIYLDPKEMQRVTALAGEWNQRVVVWETMWLRAENGMEVTLNEVLDAFKAEAALEVQAVGIPLDKSLFDSCQDEVIRAEGLEAAAA